MKYLFLRLGIGLAATPFVIAALFALFWLSDKVPRSEPPAWAMFFVAAVLVFALGDAIVTGWEKRRQK